MSTPMTTPTSIEFDDPEPGEPEAILMPWLHMDQEVPDDAPVEVVQDHIPRFTVDGPIGTGEHVVQQGECIGSIAAKYGLLPETLWAFKANQELRDARKDEYVLLPGDRVAIPEKLPKNVRVESGGRHVFLRKGIPLHLRIELGDEQAKPYANQPFVLEGEGCHEEGASSDAGLIEAWVPTELKHATLSFPQLDDDVITIEIGAMTPVGTIEGIQARLNNLGYFCGPVSNVLDPPTILALDRFRAAQGLTPQDDNALDQPTLERLLLVHGC